MYMYIISTDLTIASHISFAQVYRKAWMDDWREKGLDVVITPTCPIPAEFIDETGCSSGENYSPYFLAINV